MNKNLVVLKEKAYLCRPKEKSEVVRPTKSEGHRRKADFEKINKKYFTKSLESKKSASTFAAAKKDSSNRVVRMTGKRPKELAITFRRKRKEV